MGLISTLTAALSRIGEDGPPVRPMRRGWGVVLMSAVLRDAGHPGILWSAARL